MSATIAKTTVDQRPAATSVLLVLALSLSSPLGFNTRPRAAHAQSSSCVQDNASCVLLSATGANPPRCLGTSLPFTHTALLWANDSSTLVDIKTHLALWEGLRTVPQCWAVVQPFLCSVYMPKCDNGTNRVEYPSQELCEKTREPCSVVEQFNDAWPFFLQCSQPYFKRNCGPGTYDQLKFNTTAECKRPLIRTENSASWWEGLDGCGVQCQNPLFTDSEHDQVHVFVAVLGALCLLSTLFTILTFIIDWQNASRYPALILFFINICFLLGCVGWLAQFTGTAREDIVCRRDGTPRTKEPQLGSGETAGCAAVFVVIYYFMMAGLLWFVMLCYAWHVTFRALGTPRDDLASKTAYFHLASWSIPLVLTIVCLAISEIDGDSLSGICFVGFRNHTARAGFVLVPVGCVLVCGLFYLVKGLATLIKIKQDTPAFVGEKATAKIRETILRLGIFSALSLIFGIITYSVHIYIFVCENTWQNSLKNYVNCLTNITITTATGSTHAPKSCTLEDRPSVAAVEVNIFAFFGAGIVMSSWTWTKATLSAWERFLRMLFRKPSNKPVQLRRHRMIAQAFRRRRDFSDGRLSLSFHSTHDDPLGMKFDLHSVTSNMSNMSNFAHNVPRLIRRRGGLMHPAAGTFRRYSDSDIASVMSRRLSENSMQLGHGGDGQFVFIERENSSNNGGSSVAGWTKRRRRRRKRRKKRNAVQPIMGPVLSGAGLGTPRALPVGLRRGSDTSVLSRASAQGLRMYLNQQNCGIAGSMSSLPGMEHVPAWALGAGSISDVAAGAAAHRSSRRKIPRLEPAKRSVSSSRASSFSQFALRQGHDNLHHHFSHVPYVGVYPGYDYSNLQLLYPGMYLSHPQLAAYPFWQPHTAYAYPQFTAAAVSGPPSATTTGAGPATTAATTTTTLTAPVTDFSIFSAGAGLPGATSTPEAERRRVLTASTNRRSEVTVETTQQQTEIIPMKTMKAGKEFRKPAPLQDQSVEDLNSSELEDSGAETAEMESEKLT